MGTETRLTRLLERIRAGGAEVYYADDGNHTKGSHGYFGRDDARSGARIDPDDADALLTFNAELKRYNYSNHRREKLLRHVTRMAEEVDDARLVDALDDRDAAGVFADWIVDTYDNPRTQSDYRLALRAFGKFVTRAGPSGDPPESLAWLPTNVPSNYKPRPSPADMLDWEDDVLPLINEGARSPRDEALFAVAFEGGFRPLSELYEVRVGDVKDGQYGFEIEVDGKTGQRSVPLILAVPYLKRWLFEHPRGDDPDAYLWVKDNGERMSYPKWSEIFKRAAERAGVTKPVVPKNFRKSNATWLARLGYNEPFIEDRQGRERGSKAIARYVAMFQDSATDTYAASHGFEVETEDVEDYTPLDCPRCEEKTPRDRPVCMWCGQALSLDGARELRETEKELKRLTLAAVKGDPSVMVEVQKRRTVVDLLMEDDEFYEEAVGLADELGVEGEGLDILLGRFSNEKAGATGE